MTQTPTNYEKYLTDFQSLERNLSSNNPDWLCRVRKKAIDQFNSLGFPTARRGNEKWKYTNVSPIANTTFNLNTGASTNQLAISDIRNTVPWNDQWTNLVFENGHFNSALSTDHISTNGIRITSLRKAILSYPLEVKRHLGHYADVTDDGFTALNTAFIQDGAFIYISEGEALKSPLNIVFISTEHEEPSISYPRLLLIAEAGSKATVIESYVGFSQKRYFTNAVSEMVIGNRAQVDHHRLLLESQQAYHVGVGRVHLSERSLFTSHSFSKGTTLGRYDLNVAMDGTDSYCTLNGLYMTSASQHIDNFINIDHIKPNGTSRLHFKGVLDGKSRAIFGGTVLVRKEAQKTDSMQSDKNLVLSPDAEVDSKPALFIYADDVKCGHGATAGNIDEDTVFYMRSRGIDPETASKLLIYGFVSEIIETVKTEHLRNYLEKSFLKSLPSYTFEF